MKTINIGWLALFFACSSSSGPPTPDHCNQSDRHGTYLVHFEDVSPGCPPIQDTEVTLGYGAGGCHITASMWSENDCKLQTTLHCPSDYADIVGETTQKSWDGSYLVGTETIVTATLSCLYGLTYQRQPQTPPVNLTPDASNINPPSSYDHSHAVTVDDGPHDAALD